MDGADDWADTGEAHANAAHSKNARDNTGVLLMDSGKGSCGSVESRAKASFWSRIEDQVRRTVAGRRIGDGRFRSSLDVSGRSASIGRTAPAPNNTWQKRPLAGCDGIAVAGMAPDWQQSGTVNSACGAQQEWSACGFEAQIIDAGASIGRQAANNTKICHTRRIGLFYDGSSGHFVTSQSTCDCLVQEKCRPRIPLMIQ